MTQEIEALASQVEELTSELIQERNRNNSLEKSLQGPPKVDFTTQTDEKGDLQSSHQTLKASLGINIVELRSKNERLEKENDSLRAHIDSIDEKSARKLRDITAESEQKVHSSFLSLVRFRRKLIFLIYDVMGFLVGHEVIYDVIK